MNKYGLIYNKYLNNLPYILFVCIYLAFVKQMLIFLMFYIYITHLATHNKQYKDHLN